MKVTPTNGRIIVKPLARETKSPGGIVLPDSAEKKPTQGMVTAIGTGKLLENGSVAPVRFEEGQRVIFSGYAGQEIAIEGQVHLVLSEDEILGIVEL